MFDLTILQAAATEASTEAAQKQFGLYGALFPEGEPNWIGLTVFGILVIMSVVSFYIIFTKLFEQRKIFIQHKNDIGKFWSSPNVREGANKFEKNSAYRQLVDDGLKAEEQHGKLTDPMDQHEWMHSSLGRSQGAINSKLGTGLAFLATVGSTSPFVGLLGTVIGIYRALIQIGATGSADIASVAGPVGEALIMTALGLVVAVPAVMGYNWLQRRNKMIAEQLSTFSNDLHGFMMSGGAVRPPLRSAAAPAKATAAPAKA
ncbi:MAG: MotA/TolQ/ExbB proton channel family protein [Pseudomonadota bacterium]